MNHFQLCIINHPDCPCNSCERDSYMSYTDEWDPCCQHKKHRRNCGSKEPCPDYVDSRKKKKARPKTSKRKNIPKKIITQEMQKCQKVGDRI